MILKLPAVTISAFGRKVGRRFDPKGGGFNRGDDNPLDCDLLVVDETSMIDVMLMQPLMKAVPDRLRRAGATASASSAASSLSHFSRARASRPSSRPSRPS
jgi:AAA domain-containing protein